MKKLRFRIRRFTENSGLCNYYILEIKRGWWIFSTWMYVQITKPGSAGFDKVMSKDFDKLRDMAHCYEQNPESYFKDTHTSSSKYYETHIE